MAEPAVHRQPAASLAVLFVSILKPTVGPQVALWLQPSQAVALSAADTVSWIDGLVAAAALHPHRAGANRLAAGALEPSAGVLVSEGLRPWRWSSALWQRLALGGLGRQASLRRIGRAGRAGDLNHVYSAHIDKGVHLLVTVFCRASHIAQVYADVRWCLKLLGGVAMRTDTPVTPFWRSITASLLPRRGGAVQHRNGCGTGMPACPMNLQAWCPPTLPACNRRR